MNITAHVHAALIDITKKQHARAASWKIATETKNAKKMESFSFTIPSTARTMDLNQTKSQPFTQTHTTGATYPAGPLSANPGPKILMKVVVKTTWRLVTMTTAHDSQKSHFQKSCASEFSASICVRVPTVNPAISAPWVPKLKYMSSYFYSLYPYLLAENLDKVFKLISTNAKQLLIGLYTKLK